MLCCGGDVDIPDHILEQPIESQLLWHFTQGLKSPMTDSEELQLKESTYTESGSETSESVHTTSLDEHVNYREICRYTSPVTKTFSCHGCGISSSILMSIPRFQVVEGLPKPHAEYLVVVGLSGITVGVWRRFTHFKQFAEHLFGATASQENQESFRMSQLSWNIVHQRMRFVRCLDKEYLELK